MQILFINNDGGGFAERIRLQSEHGYILSPATADGLLSVDGRFVAFMSQAYTLDEATRKDLFCQMGQLLEEQLPVALLFTAVNADAYRSAYQNSFFGVIRGIMKEIGP